MAVNWLMGYQQADPGTRFQQGFEMAQQRQRQEALDREQAQYRQAQMEAQQAQAADRAIEANRDRFIAGAQFLQGVTDEAGYQRAIGLARQAGIDLRDVPPTYDPEYVRNVVEVGTRLQQIGQRPQQQQPPNIQREVEYYRSQGRNDLADQLLTRHAEGAPLIASNGDGTFTIVPRNTIQGGQPAPQQSAPNDPATLRAQAEEAIRNGADPAAVNARLEQMLGGGAGQPGPQTFP